MSVISRMLQDLESRGASAPVNREHAPVEVAVAKRAHPTRSRAWIRTTLLFSGLLAGGAGLYGFNVADWAFEPVGQPSQAGALSSESAQPPLAASASAVASAWHMDWALSLGLIKPKPTLTHEHVSLSEDGPPLVDAKNASATAPFTIIDPPAAGRVQSTANQAVEAYRRAVDWAEQGRDSAALDAALQAIKLDAQHMPARRLAVALALDQKQLDQAGALIDEGLQSAPKDSELLFLHARRLALVGANEQALGVLQGLDRPSGDALGLKAGLLARTGRYAPATAAYEQALKTRPDNATWWLGLGVALNAQGQGTMAKEAFLRARTLGQLSPDVQAWLDQQL